SIVDAVAQGRTIRDNITRALQFLLATNFSEILVTMGALALGGVSPLSATQFLWINLLSDVFPALALAIEPGGPGVMKREPRDPAEPLLSGRALAGLGTEAAVLTPTTLAAQWLALAHSGSAPRAATVAFSALTMSQILHALNCRAGSGVKGVAGSPTLAGVVGGTVALQALATQVPLLRSVLGVTPLGGGDWMLVGGAALPALGLVGLGRRLTAALGAGV